MFLRYLISGCLFLIPIGCVASDNAVPPGFLEGHLKILSPNPVDLGDENAATVTAENYAEYPLIILSAAAQKEIAHVNADENGNYRVALPPGDYILDVQDRLLRRLRAKPQPFTVVSDQTVRVDMDIIAVDHWRVRSPQSSQPD